MLLPINDPCTRSTEAAMKNTKQIVCPDCEASENLGLDRREFLKSVGAAAAAGVASTLPVWAVPKAAASIVGSGPSETAAAALYESLTDEQKQEICFDWDYVHPERGLLRTHVSNNWQITKPHIDSNFFTKAQKQLAHDVFKSLFNPEWYPRFLKQLKDDTGGAAWGAQQSIALFGKPGEKFQFVMTGRHMTVRADGNCEAHVALGGPIFHGHAASGFDEQVHHPGNVFWHQAVMANQVYQMLSGKQQEQALVARRPAESAVAFRGSDGRYPGLPVSELASDQKELMHKVLASLIEPYRPEDQEEIQACLEKQGGLDKCSLAFYRDGDIGDDSEWDNWRVEGPSFVWYFRGHPHVHIWINVADDPSPKLNARG
jgi:hypothetical protein